MAVNHVRPDACAYCEGKEIREANIKEEMVRMAKRSGCRIEILNQSEVLTRFGGVGCLLRYVTPDSALRTYGRTFERNLPSTKVRTMACPLYHHDGMPMLTDDIQFRMSCSDKIE